MILEVKRLIKKLGVACDEELATLLKTDKSSLEQMLALLVERGRIQKVDCGKERNTFCSGCSGKRGVFYKWVGN